MDWHAGCSSRHRHFKQAHLLEAPMRRHSLLALASSLTLLTLTAAGCGEDTSSEKSLSKEEARAAGGGKSDGVDYCQIFEWYGDGVCDDFCARPDPDCTPSC